MRYLAVWAIALALTANAFGVEVGDKVPPLNVVKWVKGKAVTPGRPDGKTTYVIEFWSSTSAPSVTAVPHLSKLQRRFKEQGVIVVGISYDDVKTTEEFAQGAAIGYRIAVDKDQSTCKEYMGKRNVIPHAFVINREGVVVWTGHPLGGMESVIELVLAGRYDEKTAKEADSLEGDLKKALTDEDPEKILSALDRLIEINPLQFSYYAYKMSVLKFQKDFDGIRKVREEAARELASSPMGLNELAWSILNEREPSLRDPALALKHAQRAVLLTERKEAALLDTLALAYYAICFLDEAIATQREAVAVADKGAAKEIEETLKYYESLKAIRDRVAESEK